MKPLFSWNASALMGLFFLCGAGCAEMDVTDVERDADDDATEVSESSLAGPFRMPAEWEPHESLWMSWPMYDGTMARPREPVYLEMVEALAPYVNVDIAVASEEEVEYVEDVLDLNSVPRSHVRLHVLPSLMDIWLRDTGPIFLKNPAGQLAVTDFAFNSWGYQGHSSEDPWDTDQLDRDIGTLLGLPIRSSNMVSEGGAIDVNGKGTMLLADAVAFHRNPGMSRAQIEHEYKKKMGIKKIVWVPEGVPEDDLSYWRNRGLPSDVYTALPVGGHVDEFVRFVAEDKVLLTEVTAAEAAVDSIAAEGRLRLEAARAAIDSATTAEGKDIEIIRVPAPELIFDTMGPGDSTYDYITTLTFEDNHTIPTDSPITVVLATSYMNYVVTNNVVLVPAYYKPGRNPIIAAKDAEMQLILSQAFPGRTIIPINPEALHTGGGGMHCITQQQPVVGNP
ncbi:agmatine deiminase family protein [Chondromyces crocatus]|uniref:Agmatine deiminase n=1 Tax=Chondromyces crocatus TaxID=52 RepID=A0A0K1ERD3_CHOCO|nr:agmatine deiminase family protein [Chondromyces crocatus]AKT43490.1 agmatine deiminase [Chondromyces crocatus]